MANKKAYYFSHDLNARNDEKILSMRVDYKYKGYGWYWAIVETMAEASGYKLKLNNGNIKGIALSLSIPAKKLEKFINDCIDKYNLFTKDQKGEYFYSESLLKRLKIRDDITEKLREAGKKGAGIRWDSHREANGEANGNPKEKKLYSDNVYLTEEEFDKLKKDYNKEIVEDYIEKLNRYIVEKGREYKSHYLTIKAWIRKEQKEKLLKTGSFSKGDSYVDLRKIKKGQ